VSVLLLNPANPLQLIVGSLDGMLRIWDYVEGRLLRTLEVGGAVLYACGHESLGDQLFVALAAEDDAVSKKARQDDKKAAPMAGIYSISLKPRSVPGSPSSLSPHPPPPAPARLLDACDSPTLVPSLPSHSPPLDRTSSPSTPTQLTSVAQVTSQGDSLVTSRPRKP
jgi:NET1-associated nuclear protein 1 (U3 small nucleolar RNA-associated protein 17)